VPPEVASIVFVIDISGSMAGSRYQRVAEALSDAVMQMNEDQQFALLLFNNLALQLDDGGLMQATAANKQLAASQLAQVLPDTPARILTTIPRVAVVRASNYGGAVGDVTRFRSAAQVYRLSGLVPRLYESAGKKRSATLISREGKVELREAIIDLGKALRHGHPDFARYAAELLSRGKPKGVVNCALGQRANRVACAMMRDQRPFDPTRW
jgi:transposase